MTVTGCSGGQQWASLPVTALLDARAGHERVRKRFSLHAGRCTSNTHHLFLCFSRRTFISLPIKTVWAFLFLPLNLLFPCLITTAQTSRKALATHCDHRQTGLHPDLTVKH